MRILPAKIKILLALAKMSRKIAIKLSRSVPFHMKTRVSVKYFVTDCRLRLGLRHLNKHKFKHGFNETINLICIGGDNIESINYFFTYCCEYSEAR